MPLLHRPTFEKYVEAKRHLTDEAFGSTVLLVCAIGSRFSGDSRVLEKEEIIMNGSATEQKIWRSAGWQWFREVQTTRKAMYLGRTRLFDVQICCVSRICGAYWMPLARLMYLFLAGCGLSPWNFDITPRVAAVRHRPATCARTWRSSQENVQINAECRGRATQASLLVSTLGRPRDHVNN